MTHVATTQEDALVVTAEIDGFKMKRIYVDGGSLVDIVFLNALETIGR